MVHVYNFRSMSHLRMVFLTWAGWRIICQRRSSWTEYLNEYTSSVIEFHCRKFQTLRCVICRLNVSYLSATLVVIRSSDELWSHIYSSVHNFYPCIDYCNAQSALYCMTELNLFIFILFILYLYSHHATFLSTLWSIILCSSKCVVIGTSENISTQWPMSLHRNWGV